MSLLLNGQRIPGTERVRENIIFKPGMPNTRKNMKPQGFGLHWTGAENPSTRVISTLKSRKLSVHLIGEKTGDLVQTADLSTICAHIGTGNPRFIGIEMVCRGFATKEDLAIAKAADPTLRDRDELDWAEARDTYRDTIGGREIGMASFDPRMIENVLWLSETLAGVFAFPRVIPWRKVIPTDKFLATLPLPNPESFLVSHEGSTWLPAFDRDFAPKGRAATYRGVLGHCHLHDEKYDPGTQPFYALWAEGWNPAAKKLPGAMAGLVG